MATTQVLAFAKSARRACSSTSCVRQYGHQLALTVEDDERPPSRPRGVQIDHHPVLVWQHDVWEPGADRRPNRAEINVWQRRRVHRGFPHERRRWPHVLVYTGAASAPGAVRPLLYRR